jgi:predicted Rossmann fold nucleotide-binding protein DprA/Smf involved in DNA uptake
VATTEPRGIAVVGSRDATRIDNQIAYTLGRAISAAGYVTVSGGARGIDQHAQNGAFDGDGPVVAVIADSLMRNLVRPRYRNEIEADRLLLLTPYSPDTGFSAGNALGRNRLVYCLADAAIAVCSTNGSGGTYAGATQNLKAGWVPLWVGQTDDPHSGNPALVEAGARWLPPIDGLAIDTLFTPPTNPP